MIFGSNDVYEPVAAYDVGQYTRNGIISGGNRGNETMTQGVTFTWVYDPATPYAAPSGFTGTGWHCGEPNTPLAHATVQDVQEEIQTEGNLNRYFTAWQQIVSNQEPGTTDYVKDFMATVGFGCFSTNAAS